MPERPHEFDPIRAFDRPGLAVARLVEGDFGAAGRALVSPRTLSPRERTSLISQFIGKREAETPYGQVLATLTNPFVILGAILSIRYPVQSVANLTKIASRLKGYDRYINPVAKLVGSLDDTFAGTPVPKLMRGLSQAIHGYRSKYLGDTGDLGLTQLMRGFQTRAGVRITPQQSYRVAMKLDGLDEPGSIVARQLGIPYVVKPLQLNQAETWLYRQIKERWLPAQYKEGLAAGGPELLVALRRDGLAARSNADIKQLREFFPHMLSRSTKALELDTLQLLSRTAYGERATRAARKVSTIHAKDRRNGMLPSRDDLRLVERESLHPDLMPRLEEEISRRAHRFNIDPDKYQPPREYTLNLIPTLERYTNSVARAFGFTTHPAKYGAAINREYQTAVAAGPQGIVKAEMLKNTYIPWALGQQTFVQGVKAAEWAGTKAWAMTKLQSPTFQKLVPAGWRKRLEDMILEGHTLRSPGTAGGGLAGWFYVSALGLNPASATLNLMQTLLTTAPTIGAKWTYRGMESTFKKGSQYFRLRGQGMASEAAMMKAFTEFHQAGLTNVSTLDESLGGILDEAWAVGAKTPGGLRDVTGRIKSAMMALFSGTERFNRFVAFEGARLKALSEGVRGQAALDFGSEVMERTQFTPGILGTPYGLINLPSWLRQFTTFGTKYATFLMGKAIGAQGLGLAGRDLGTLGRMSLSSGLTYEAGKRLLDTDLSHGLLFGALPSPRRDSPLGVIPFTPPAVTLPAAVLKSILDEDLAPLQRELPLLMPAGVAGARAFGPLAGRVLPESVVRGVSKFIGKEYTDYSRPAEGGRYPVYDSKGRLKGNFTGLQLLMRASGLPVGDIQREAEFMGYLIKQKEQMRDYKRSWLDAYMNNDERGQQSIEEDFKTQYQIDLPIKKSDIKAAEMRRDVTRLERMLQTMPKAARPQFGAILGTAISSQAEGLLGIDPASLQEGTIRSRRAP